MPQHIIMDPSGHTTIEFDTSNMTDLAEAERRFNRLVARGYVPAVREGVGKHYIPEQTKRIFDPHWEETIFVPALKGG